MSREIIRRCNGLPLAIGLLLQLDYRPPKKRLNLNGEDSLIVSSWGLKHGVRIHIEIGCLEKLQTLHEGVGEFEAVKALAHFKSDFRSKDFSFLIHQEDDPCS